MADTLALHPLGPDLHTAERLALWSLRHVLRPDPPPCPPSTHRLSCGLAPDLARVRAGFRRAVERLGLSRAAPFLVCQRNSLSLSAHESVVLRYLARLQFGTDDEAGSLAPLLSDRRFLPALTEALDELAAILAFGGYWLADPQDLPVPFASAWAQLPNLASAHSC